MKDGEDWDGIFGLRPKRLLELKRVGCGKRFEHGPFNIDHELNTVECANCKKKLNPMWVLKRMARTELKLSERWKALKEMEARLSVKQRAQCEHCRRITRVKL